MKRYCKHCIYSRLIEYTGFACFPPISLDEQIQVTTIDNRHANHRDFILASNNIGECEYYKGKWYMRLIGG